MKLEDQVCSLELAKRLKELGVKQEGEFYWVHVPGKPYFLLNEGSTLVKAMDGRSYFDDGNATSAFTSSELGEILPHFAYSKKVLGDSFRWFCIFEKTPIGKEFLSEKSYEYAQTEADARAKMLIHLIEKGIVKP